MILYIAFAFRHMPNPFRWGFSAVVALLHDVLIVMGVFSILGWLIGYQVDSMFIVAMLTIVGFAINNTCVVYDRIRENVRKGISRDFATTVNSPCAVPFRRGDHTAVHHGTFDRRTGRYLRLHIRGRAAAGPVGPGP
jgi:preprotein translocase SecF subunit